jgi:uncharacterized protein (DUF2252 family)
MTEDTSLRLPTFADVLREAAPQSRRVLILDSCFSAAAVQSFQAPLEQVTAAKVHESVPDRGVALLCASSASDAASFTQDRTKFTGALLDVLTAGDPVPDVQISLHRVCDLTQRRLLDLYGEEATRPECHTPNQSGGDISMSPLFPNPAATAPDSQTGSGGAREASAAPRLADQPPVLRPQTALRPLSVASPSWAWTTPDTRHRVVPLIHDELRHIPTDLARLRLGRMALSPVSFFRGSFTVMASDLSSLRWSGITTRLCGDSAITNAVISPTPDGRHVLDLSDYGETVVGPLEYDIYRLLVSVVLRGRDQGLSKLRKVAEAVIGSYVAMVDAIAARSAFEQEFFSFDERALEHLDVPDILAAYRVLALGSRPSRRKSLLDKTGTRFRENPPLLMSATGPDRTLVEELVRRYKEGISAERKAFLSRFQLVDVATRVVGVASVGRRNYVVLCCSAQTSEMILLQVTEARPPAYTRWLTGPDDPTMSEGTRVVLGTRAAQTSPDPLLDFVDFDGTSFVFRAFNVDAWGPAAEARSRTDLTRLGVSLAALLAKVHLRHLDPREVQAQVGDGRQFQRNLGVWAVSYARQVEADFAEFVAAIREGSLTADFGA